MAPATIDAAIREFGQRHQNGDLSAAAEFEHLFGRPLRLIVKRILRSSQPRTSLEVSIQMHLSRLSANSSRLDADRIVVQRIIESLLELPPQSSNWN